MAKSLDLTPREIQLYVSHLVYWQKALIVNSIDRFTVLMMNPTSSFHNISKRVLELIEKDKQIDLITLLKGFETPKTLGDHKRELNLEEKKNKNNIFIMLLQNGIVIERNTYVYYKLNEKDEGGEKLILSKKKNISEKELSIYQRVKKYSLKNVHLNEISWRENLSIKEIIPIFDTYDDLLGRYYI
jgi:hypothetical protein